LGRLYVVYVALRWLARIKDEDADRLYTVREVWAVGADYCRTSPWCKLPLSPDAAARQAVAYLTKLRAVEPVTLGAAGVFRLAISPYQAREKVAPILTLEA